MAIHVNERKCNPGHITLKEQRCTKNIKLLVVIAWPYHLVREFSHVIWLTVYLLLSAAAMAACEDFHSTRFGMARRSFRRKMEAQLKQNNRPKGVEKH